MSLKCEEMLVAGFNMLEVPECYWNVQRSAEFCALPSESEEFCAVPLEIETLSPDTSTRELISQLANDDHYIFIDQIPRTPLGQLECNDVTKKWPETDFARVEDALIKSNALGMRRFASCKEAQTLELKEELNGDYDLGVVIHVKDYHFSPEGKTTSENCKSLVIRYQYETLKALAKFKPKHIFQEQLATDLTIYDVARLYNSTFVVGGRTSAIENLFPLEDLPSTPTDSQSYALRLAWLLMRTSIFYAMLEGTVTVHKTVSEELQMKGENFRISLMRDIVSEEVAREYYSLVEKSVANEIANFLEKNPGETVVLILGVNHDLKDDLTKLGDHPPLITLRFGQLGDAIMQENDKITHNLFGK